MTISLQNVSFDYVEKELTFRALHEVNLEIGSGEFVALIGPSGSGKTTLMNLVGLLARPTTGSVKVDGQETTTLLEAARAHLRNEYLGFVFQRFELFGRHSALENVLEPLTYRSRISSHELAQGRNRARHLLAMLGLSHKLGNLPSELSGGQKQRVAIARALVTQPRLILADEPTGALDSHTSLEVMGMLSALHRAGHTVVLVTHSPEVAAYAHRIISIRDGRIASDEQNPTPTASATTADAAHEALTARAAPSDSHLETSRLQALLWLVRQPIRACLSNLRRNLWRSFLTSVGLLIGILALVVFTGMGGFLESSLRKSLSKPSDQMLNVEFDEWTTRGKGLDGSWPGVPLGTAWESLAREFSTEGQLIPRYSTAKCRFAGSEGEPVAIPLDTAANSLRVGARYLATQGRLLTPADLSGRASVAIVTSATVDAVFAKTAPERTQPGFPIGAVMRVQECASGLALRIVGVVKSRSGEGMGDKNVVIPFDTFAASSLETILLHDFAFIPKDTSDLNKTARVMQNRFMARFNVSFWVSPPNQMGRELAKMLAGFRFVVTVLGLLALIVGGIGVLNIMVVTVAERVREIGVMKSLGATPRIIRNRFLLESVLLCLGASFIGILLGGAANTLGAYAVSRWEPEFNFSWSILWSPGALGAGLFSGLFCGLVFGYFPARRAGKLDPVECLRTR